MTISNAQARAARAYLDLSQQAVADAVGLEKNDISRFETGKTLTESKKKKIAQYYKGCLYFNENDGVEPIPENDTRTLKGQLGFKAFMDDVYQLAKTEGGDICIFNSKPKLWYEWLSKEWYEKHAERMEALGDKIRVRIIVEKDEEFLIMNSADHRYYPKNLHSEKIFYIYGSKFAYLNFSKNDVEIRVFNQKEFADIHKESFELSWEHSEPIS